MEQIKVDYPQNGERLLTLLKVNKSGNRFHEIGTAFLPAGTTMPDSGTSAHEKHEVSIILEGKIKTYSEQGAHILEAGDIISIPEKEVQRTEVINDTRLIYIFFDK